MRRAERAVLPDLENSESFVTLFHAQIYAKAHRLTFVDCGHGYAFLRRGNGAVRSLTPRGLPLGVPGRKIYREGAVSINKGDTLVLYSDGLIDARPELALNSRMLAKQLRGAASAQEMIERLIDLTEQEGPLPDDITVLVVHCTG
jgi:serine phosphatase RsbU (regulator of sigma subunit)